MKTSDKTALAVEGPPGQLELAREAKYHKHRTGQHKTVPRWLRMSLRTSLLVGMVALPTLAVKEPSFVRLHQYRGFSIVFAALGAFVVPMWIPQLGDVVLAFTAIIPVALASLWLAYGLFMACSSIIFMMLLCVAVGGAVFFLAELYSLPVSLLSVFPTLFIVGSSLFVQHPARAWMITLLVTLLLFIAAIVATAVCALVFPEYCVDEVFRHHHEALEHLLHLAYHCMGLRPPRLLKRVTASAAAAIGGGSSWKDAFRAADELPSNLQALALGDTGQLVWEPSADDAAADKPNPGEGAGPASGFGAAGFSSASMKMERSWHRVAMACTAGSKALTGTSGEVVLMAAHHKRIIIPCSPLIPCARGQIDTEGLQALRHLALSTALLIIKVYNATQPLEANTGNLLQQLLSRAEWTAMRSALLESLHELTDAFPMDYYPIGAPPDRTHLRTYQAAVISLQGTWKARLSQQQQQQQGDACSKHTASTGSGAPEQPSTDHTAVDIAQQQEGPAAAAAVESLAEPLVMQGSPAALVVARMSAIHMIKLLQDLGLMLEQLYDAVERVSQHMLSCKCC